MGYKKAVWPMKNQSSEVLFRGKKTDRGGIPADPGLRGKQSLKRGSFCLNSWKF